MINYKQFLFGIIFLLFSTSLSNAKDKVSYIDIDYILSNTLAGKSLLASLKKEEELKISKFKLNDENFTKEEKKILAKKNLISSAEFEKEIKSLQVKFQKYKQNKFNEIEELKKKEIKIF